MKRPKQTCALAVVVLLWTSMATLIAQTTNRQSLQPPSFSPAQIQDAETLIKEVFNEEYAKEKTDGKVRRQLAITLLEQSKRLHDDPRVRYVALREALDLAARAGDQQTAFAAIAELAKHHKIDVQNMQAESLAVIIERLMDETERMRIARLTLDLANRLGDQDAYERAVRFAQLAETAAKKSKDKDLQQSIKRRLQELEVAYKETQRLQPYFEKLKANPDDPQANLEVGKSWCLVRDKWEKGLPYLVRSNHPVLRKLAQTELRGLQKGSEQAQLAEDWWQAAQRAAGDEKLHMLRRSYQWYVQAIYLVDGQMEALARQRLKQLLQLLPAHLRMTDISVELRQLVGHQGEVLDVVFAPNPRFAASAGADGTVRLWDVTTGEMLKTCKGHLGTVYSVVFSPDGRYMFSSGEDKTVRMWEVGTGKEVRKFTGARDVLAGAAVSPDGTHLAAGGAGKVIHVWEVHSGKEVRQIRGHGGMIFKVLYSPDGKYILSAGDDQTIRLWNAHSGEAVRTFRGHQGQVLGLALAADGERLLSSGEDSTIRLWEMKTGKEIRRYKGHRSAVGSVAFSPDGERLLSAGDDRTLRLWDVESGMEIRQLTGHTDAVYRVVFSPDGRRALSCALDRTLRLWGERR